MNKQKFFSLFILMSCLWTAGVGQHCPWDSAYLLSIGAYSAQEPNTVIPDLTNWDSGPEGANMDPFHPISVQLSPVSPPQASPVQRILWTAQWSANDEYIAIGSADSLLRIYAGNSYELLHTFKMEGGVLRVRWHPTQPLLAVAAEGKGSCILNVSTKQRTPLPLPKDPGSRSVVWNPAGDQVLIADYEGLLSLWSLTGDLLGKHEKENTMSYTAVDWHPKKAEWLVVSQKLRSYTTKGELISATQIRPPEVLLLCVAWHPSGDFYVVGDYGNSDYEMPPLLQWRNAKGEVMFVSEISKAEYRNISWSPKGKTLATASDMLRIWSKKGKLLVESPAEHNLWGIDWSQDGKRIVTSDQEGVIGIWDAEGNRLKTLYW